MRKGPIVKTNQDYLKEGVELADGWESNAEGDIYGPFGPIGFGLALKLSQEELDALAAQLIRQVDALDGSYVVERRTATEIHTDQFKESMEWRCEHEGRAMNAIKVIVDSKVLVK